MKLVIIGLSLYITWMSYYNWNWYKNVTNFNCYDSNPQIKDNIVSPYTDLYLQLFQFSIASSIISVVMAVIDIIHFVYIYKTDLKYYLVDSEGRMIVQTQEDEELKWMDEKMNQLNSHGQVQDIQDQDVDQFKITMAQNMFANEEENIKNERPKKKKKKKGGLLQRVNNPTN